MDTTIKGALLRWWAGLQNDRGARAELRRCASLLEVMQTPAFHAARHKLIEAGWRSSGTSDDRLAAVIALAAHLKSDGGSSPPQAFSNSDPPVVSPLRFRQILEARDDEEFFLRLRRVLPLAEGLSLSALADDVLYWGDNVRKRWVYDYRWPQKQTA
jgi:CRISPR system Cascade subunit CasB